MASNFALPFRNFFSTCNIDINAHPSAIDIGHTAAQYQLHQLQATCVNKKLKNLYNYNTHLIPVSYNDEPRFGWYFFIEVTQEEFTVGNLETVANQWTDTARIRNQHTFKEWTMPIIFSHLKDKETPLLVYVDSYDATQIQINLAHIWAGLKDDFVTPETNLFVNTWEVSSLQMAGFDNPNLRWDAESGWYSKVPGGAEICPCWGCGQDLDSIYAIYYLGENLHPSTRVINHPRGL